jgi:hypothetical protein
LWGFGCCSISYSRDIRNENSNIYICLESNEEMYGRNMKILDKFKKLKDVIVNLSNASNVLLEE